MCRYENGGGEALESIGYRYVPTIEWKQGVFGVGFCRKKVDIGCGIQKNWAFFGVKFSKFYRGQMPWGFSLVDGLRRCWKV